MYKVYDCIGHTETPGYLLERYGIPFQLEMDKWQFVNNIKDAELILCMDQEFSIKPAIELSSPEQIIVVLELWHMENNTGVKNTIDNAIAFHGLSGKKVVWVHENYLNQDPQYAYYDIMFNRSKVYFTDYDKIDRPEDKVWTLYTNKQVYDLSEISLHEKTKKFLAPMRIYGPGYRMDRRRKLRELLVEYSDIGLMNDTSNNVFFEVTGGYPDKALKDHVEKFDGGTWYPVGNKYYDDAFASIFIESITEADEAILASEKTFDPLIKGHFILPFSTPGYVKWLQEHYGFAMPIWMDYSYDDEYNNDARFFKFLASVVKYLQTDIRVLHDRVRKDKWMLEHNRNVFYNRPYHSLYESIYKCIKFNGY